MLVLAVILVLGQLTVIWTGQRIVSAVREHTAAVRLAILAFQGTELMHHQYNRALLEELRRPPQQGVA